MREYLGLGVIGNFANHLEQAGEASCFTNTITSEECAPKGIFPFYVPNNSTFLGRYCFDNTKIIMPNIEHLALQAEPEMAIECHITYNDNKITNIQPISFMAFNDASIRNNTCGKLSEKKNFSTASKGYGQKIQIDTFDIGGICDKYALTSFVIINDEIHQYGDNTALTNYSYFYQKLITWLINQINTQQDCGALENISTIIANANFPTKTIIAIGATSYTEIGQKRYLKENDEICIVAYDSTQYTHSQIQEMIQRGTTSAKGISIVRQKIVK